VCRERGERHGIELQQQLLGRHYRLPHDVLGLHNRPALLPLGWWRVHAD
jgi:hypothetical protein